MQDTDYVQCTVFLKILRFLRLTSASITAVLSVVII